MKLLAYLLAAVFVLSGCVSEPSKADHTVIVTKTVTKYVKLDPALTKRCLKTPPLPTVGGAVQVAHSRGECVDRLNGQMDQIEKIQDTMVKENGDGT